MMAISVWSGFETAQPLMGYYVAGIFLTNGTSQGFQSLACLAYIQQHAACVDSTNGTAWSSGAHVLCWRSQLSVRCSTSPRGVVRVQYFLDQELASCDASPILRIQSLGYSSVKA